MSNDTEKSSKSPTSNGNPPIRWGFFLLFVIATVGIFVLWQQRPNSYAHGEPSDTLSIEKEPAEDLRSVPNPIFGNALIASIAEEIYVRDGVAMGLVATDTVIRQRIIQQQRMAMTPDAPSVSEDALRAWFSAHQEQFRVSAGYSFEQRFFRSNNTAEFEQAVDLIINAQTLPPDVGDPFVHGTVFNRQTETQIEALFGGDFARALTDAPHGRWFGPIDSNFGKHLIRVTDFSEPHAAIFENVRDEVYAAWASTERDRTFQEELRKLRGEYTIVVPEDLTRIE